MSTRQQRWAQATYEIVQGYQKSEKFEKKYRSYCRSLPSLLQQSGLIQGIIFTQTRTGAQHRGEEVGRQLIIDLAKVYDSTKTPERLITEIQKADLREYMRLSSELIAISVWFRRYTSVLLSPDDEEA